MDLRVHNRISGRDVSCEMRYCTRYTRLVPKIYSLYGHNFQGFPQGFPRGIFTAVKLR